MRSICFYNITPSKFPLTIFFQTLKLELIRLLLRETLFSLFLLCNSQCGANYNLDWILISILDFHNTLSFYLQHIPSLKVNDVWFIN